jgi:hypothetical protein
MKQYILYKDSGEITNLLSIPESMLNDQLSDGIYALECDDSVLDTTHYVSNNEIFKKKALEYTLNIDGFTVAIDGLPAGLLVEIRGVSVVTDDDPTTIEFDKAGIYTLQIYGSVEHLDENLELKIGNA